MFPVRRRIRIEPQRILTERVSERPGKRQLNVEIVPAKSEVNVEVGAHCYFISRAAGLESMEHVPCILAAPPGVG